MNTSTIRNGEIRHVTRTPEVIIKVSGPFNLEVVRGADNVPGLKMYIQTNEFPKYHYVVVLDLIDSFTEPGNKFYVAKLITHSADFDNLKVTEELYDKSSTTLDLSNSYITRDRFLIPESEIQINKVYGNFYLDKLQAASEY